MEWVAEGLALGFVGFVLLFPVTKAAGSDDPVTRLVVWAVIGFCVVMGIWDIPRWTPQFDPTYQAVPAGAGRGCKFAGAG